VAYPTLCDELYAPFTARILDPYPADQRLYRPSGTRDPTAFLGRSSDLDTLVETVDLNAV